MAENYTGRKHPKSQSNERGSFPNRPGPYIGEVMDNYDVNHTGRVKVFIAEWAGDEKLKSLENKWVTVNYASPFLGSTIPGPRADEDSEGIGYHEGNPSAYGMWFPVPDIGVKVICIFMNGDPDMGYYIASIPNPDTLHQVPAIGAYKNFKTDSEAQAIKYAEATQLPVTEINTRNKTIVEDAQVNNVQAQSVRRPVHAFHAATMYQQGVIKDPIRGPITSTAYRESPSRAFGISTPGIPVYSADLHEYNIIPSFNSGGVSEKDIKIVGRKGGHSLVMDDGDVSGKNALMRFRTSKGHQITMSDDGDCLHIMHANGQSWIELGKEGTLDVYAANSINLRSQGDINLHADQNINMFAGQNAGLNAKKTVFVEGQEKLSLIGEKSVVMYSSQIISYKSDGTIVTESLKGTNIKSGGPVSLHGGPLVLLNTGGKMQTMPPDYIKRTTLPDVSHTEGGWVVANGALESITSRAPTHEPYPHHNKGVSTNVTYDPGGSVPPNESVANKLNSLYAETTVDNTGP